VELVSQRTQPPSLGKHCAHGDVTGEMKRERRYGEGENFKKKMSDASWSKKEEGSMPA
jgi:hypothetical protein